MFDNKAYQKAYYQTNKTRTLARQKAYYQANKDHVQEYREATKESRAIQRAGYYQANKDRLIQENKLRMWIRRMDIICHLGGKCVKCGYFEHLDALEVDHVTPGQKALTSPRLISKPWAIVVEELDKCQLLCANCHAIKSNTERREGAYYGATG